MHRNENVVAATKLPSPAALEVIILTTSSAASDENLEVVKMITSSAASDGSLHHTRKKVK